jgi:hypothetical protein
MVDIKTTKIRPQESNFSDSQLCWILVKNYDFASFDPQMWNLTNSGPENASPEHWDL